MGFADDILAEEKKGPPCGVAVVLAEMTKALAADVDDAIRNRPDVSAAAIARKLNTMGHKVSSGTVLRHRKGECQCRSLTK